MGTEQEDAIRNIKGSFGIDSSIQSLELFDQIQTTGAFGQRKGSVGYIASSNPRHDGRVTEVNFDASRVVSTSNENRPKNTAFLPRLIAY